MSHDYFVGEISQKAIITYNGKFLICRDSKDAPWELPGGRVNRTDTSPQSGLERELEEELGLTVQNIRPFYTCFSFHESTGQTRYLTMYLAEAQSDTTTFNDQEVVEATWITIEQILQFKFYPDIQEVLEVFQKLPAPPSKSA